MKICKNLESLLLDNEENKTIFNLIGENNWTLATTVAQIFTAKLSEKTLKWKKVCFGVITFVKDCNEKAYFIRVWNVGHQHLLVEFEITVKTLYTILETFHKVVILKQNLIYGFNFADRAESAFFGKTVSLKILKLKQSKNNGKDRYISGLHGLIRSTYCKVVKAKNLKKQPSLNDISEPKNFMHVMHMGVDTQFTYEENLKENKMKKLWYRFYMGDLNLNTSCSLQRDQEMGENKNFKYIDKNIKRKSYPAPLPPRPKCITKSTEELCQYSENEVNLPPPTTTQSDTNLHNLTTRTSEIEQDRLNIENAISLKNALNQRHNEIFDDSSSNWSKN
ncbi:hypothetical protein A3Q56_07125 [Intoshia linei]|uniref:CRIB domain-containing protein n=1 Tax=Intoshia linei TaxID=1819745 RepID=A0A177AT33_9BILA|nr:hypothetical protein A3Q56_07125 [Intoshia linei]